MQIGDRKKVNGKMIQCLEYIGVGACGDNACMYAKGIILKGEQRSICLNGSFICAEVQRSNDGRNIFFVEVEER